MPSVWEHDLWKEIYEIPDPAIKNTLAKLYRLVLDMRESDILAEKVAARISKRDRLVLSVSQKVIGFMVSGVIVIDTVLHIRSAVK